jgi:hypothetical protein
VLVMDAGGEEGAVGWGEGVTLAQECACDATFLDIDGYAGEFVEQ